MSKLSLIDKFRHAWRVSVPLVAINTPDPAATIRRVLESLNGSLHSSVSWDSIRGVTDLANAASKMQVFVEDGIDITPFNMPAFLQRAALYEAPEGQKANGHAILFVHNADQYLNGERMDRDVMQGIWNLRDVFKANRRMLVLLSTGLRVPAALHNDVVVFDEELPTPEELGAIIEEQDAAASAAHCPRCNGAKTDKGLPCESCGGTGTVNRPRMTPDEVTNAVEATRGLSNFAAEQAVAQALRRGGTCDCGGDPSCVLCDGTGRRPPIDNDHLWQLKISEVEQCRGLTIYRGGQTFSSLGGLRQVKQYLNSVMHGRKPPAAIVWIDEIEKTGLGARQELSGVNQDLEGAMLSYMEDNEVRGIMLLGVPGCGKSALCKAVGPESGRIVIRVDLGAMPGSLVGESQQNLRNALKVVQAVAGNEALWLATSNSIDGLSGAMRSRFTDTFFFDLPDAEEREAIWNVWLDRYELGRDQRFQQDEGWVGRNIKKCCFKAWDLNIPVTEAARSIVPVGVSEAADISRLRKEANGKYLSATCEGIYQTQSASTARSVAVFD